MRLSGALLFVSDLRRSEAFYQRLLEPDITTESAEAALLRGRTGTLLVLRALSRAPHMTAAIGVHYLVWTARDAEDLERCEAFLKAHGTFVSSTFDHDVKVVEGRDPDDIPVIVVYPQTAGAAITSVPTRMYVY